LFEMIRTSWLAMVLFPSRTGPRRCHGRYDFVLDQLPDLVHVSQEFRAALQCKIARPCERNTNIGGDPAGPMRKNQHAVGKIDRLVDLMGDEEYSLAFLRPDIQKLA